MAGSAKGSLERRSYDILQFLPPILKKGFVTDYSPTLFYHPSWLMKKKGAATAGAGLYVDSFFATSACATPIHTIAIACGRNPLKLWVLQFFI